MKQPFRRAFITRPLRWARTPRLLLVAVGSVLLALLGAASDVLSLRSAFTENGPPSPQEVAEAIAAGDRVTSKFAAGSTEMTVELAVQESSGGKAKGRVDVRPGDRATALIAVTNIGGSYSPNIEVLVDVPDGLLVVPRTTPPLLRYL